MSVFSIGIWERGDGLAARVRPRLAPDAVQLRAGHEAAAFGGAAPDLLVLSPLARGWAGVRAMHCRMLLLPGSAAPLVRSLRADCAVSYGTSPRDTLTFSSLEGERICLALQRELVTLGGDVVEQQELLLPFPPDCTPALFLATAGTLLLAGVTPEALGALLRL